MTDDIQQNLEKSGEKPRKPGTFQPGYDPRRNMTGRKPPKDIKALNKLIDEIGAEMVEHPITHEQTERFRAMLRSMMTGKDGRGKTYLLDRRYGKVQDRVDVTSNGETITPKVDDERFDRAISTLADAIRESVLRTGTKPDGKVDTTE
jgi:predicted ATPase